MPRTSLEAPPPPVVKTPALMASAVRYPGNTVKIYQGNQAWQDDAWRFYDITGELRFAANWIANVLSRATLKAAKRDLTGAVTTDDPSNQAIAALAALFAGSEGQSAMLSALGLHLTVAGEAYIVGRTITGAGGASVEKWEVVGVKEMRSSGSRWTIVMQGQAPIELTDDDVIIRVWRPHPRNRIEADSPVRSLLPVLTELEYLTRHVFAQVTSRLAGAGVLVLPQGMSFPAPTNGALPADATSADQFMAVLGEAMLTPIKDPSNPAALVPIVVTVPDELVDKANLLHFWTDLDQHAIEMRNEAIRRFALGMDIPPEVVLGVATSGSAANHWTSWQIEESSIKVHIEPLLQLITDAITDGYLDLATGDVTDVVISDTSAIRLRPDRSKEAFELYDRGVIDAEALRRENGFAEDDTPDEDEFKNWLLRKVAAGSPAPDQVAAALRLLGIDVPSDSPVPANDPSPVPEQNPNPSIRDHPTRQAPERAAALLAAGDVLVFRALERAGNRLRSATGQKPSCEAWLTYLHITPPEDQRGHPDYLLSDAWGCVDRIIGAIGADPIRVKGGLDRYTRHLLANQEPHDPNKMMRFLAGERT